MCKKNVKWYLIGTDKVISTGDEVTYHQSISFSKYPNTVFESNVTHPLDEEDIKILIDSEIIEEKKTPNMSSYVDYIKWLAQKENKNYVDVLNAFTLILEISPVTALNFLLKTISRNINENVKYPYKVWIINAANLKPVLVDVTEGTNINNIPYFVDIKDAIHALNICKPIIEKING